MTTNPASREGGSSPIFILCTARSGSTLLRFVLDAHPEVACPPEPGLALAFRDISAVYGALSEDAVDSEAIGAACRALAADSIGAYASRRGKARWCDKSLSSVDHAELLVAVYPEARFVCLHRDCFDTVASAIEANPWGFDAFGLEPYVRRSADNFVEALVTYWCDKTSLMLEFAERNRERCHQLRYEALVADPASVVAELLAFLGLSPDFELAEAFDARHSSGPGDYKIGFTERIHSRSVGRGWRVPRARVSPEALLRVSELEKNLPPAPVIAVNQGDPASDVKVPESASPDATGSFATVTELMFFRVQERLQTMSGSSDAEGLGSDVGALTLSLDDGTEEWHIDLENRELRRGSGSSVFPTVRSESRTILQVANHEENAGLLLRRGAISVVRSPGSAANEQGIEAPVKALLRLIS